MLDVNKISREEEELLTRIAWEYYVNESRQEEIAKSLGISRSTISRLIKRARDVGIVSISINSDMRGCIELEEQLKKRFKLSFASVVPARYISTNMYDGLGRSAANFINRNLPHLRSIAVGWGRTISSISQYAQVSPATGDGSLAEVVEMIGNFTSTGINPNSLRLSLNLAHAYGASASVLSAPALTADEVTCETLKSHVQIKSVLEKARGADLAVASLGTVDESSTLRQIGLLGQKDLSNLVKLGAEGEILGRFFDVNGHAIHTSLDNRLVGLTLEELAHLPAVMIVAGGQEKVRPIRAALKGGFITHLVTDETTARGVLET